MRASRAMGEHHLLVFHIQVYPPILYKMKESKYRIYIYIYVYTGKETLQQTRCEPPRCALSAWHQTADRHIELSAREWNGAEHSLAKLAKKCNYKKSPCSSVSAEGVFRCLLILHTIVVLWMRLN